MTAYAVVCLVIAGVCAFFALIHGVLFLLVRRDRVQRAVSLSFLGFTLVNLGIAGSGRSSGQAGSPSGIWLLVGALAILPLWIGLLLTAWEMVGKRLNTNRKVLLVAVSVMGALRIADILLTFPLLSNKAITWERVMNSTESITTLPAWGITLLVGGTCFYEAMRDLGRTSIAAWVLALTSAPATALCVREVALTLGWAHGPTWLGLTGLPFLLTASGIVVMRYLAAMREQKSGGEISGYKLLRRLQAGGMGELFLAARVGPAGFERHVGLKKMLVDEDSEAVERFLAEARMAAALEHPNIVSVHDLGQIDGGWFIAMEYLSGVSLAQVRDTARLHKVKIPVAFAVEVAEKVARGLAYAHQKGVIHRDVSPQNVMVTFDGQIKIIDFGIAVEVGRRRKTSAGQVVGKGAYLSPERISGMPGEPASDVYALGILLYELVCGQRPFAGTTTAEVAESIRKGYHVPITDLCPDAPPPLVQAVEAALEFETGRRISAEAFASALAATLARLKPVAPGSWVRALCRDRMREERVAAVYAGMDWDSNSITSVRVQG